ncbi:MAG: hypothetical protein Q4F72_07365, partial [Desulfovibrionaceae bacterium]|nr:hypothetical protein [Desulfovibrionaceae bacterium]
EDPQMQYKNAWNAEAWRNRGEYDSHEYHSHPSYIAANRQAKEDRLSGTLQDAYTGETFPRNGKTNLDHVISAKEVHEDRGRVLAGLSGPDLANSPENLKITGERTNKSKKADSMEDFLLRRGDEYTEEQKRRMLATDAAAREAYEHKLFVGYYTSPAFLKDMAAAGGAVALKMGLRQVLGLAFAEIWFSVKEEFARVRTGFTLKEFFEAVAAGVRRGVERVKAKYRELLRRFREGVIAGALSSISTTLCNVFFTTAKSVVRILRQTWASLVEAINILLFNPDSLLLGDRIMAAVKVLAVGASVVAGTLVSEIVAKSPVGAIPVVGETAQIFCGTLVSGILSCTLLYALDRSSHIRKIKDFLNSLPSVDGMVQSCRRHAEQLAAYVAELEKIDLASFKREVGRYHAMALSLDANAGVDETARALERIYAENNLRKPYEGSFGSFMSDRSKRLTFE